MTLILTWLDKRKIVQVSDQRLTLPDGSLFDEQALKTICVRSCDCSFLLSYTGEAYMPQWSRTDYWLTAAIQPLTLRPLDDLIEGLCFRLNNDAAPKKRLCVVAAGFCRIPTRLQYLVFLPDLEFPRTARPPVKRGC